MSTTTTSTHPLATAEGPASLVRPRFTPGLLLLDEDLTAGVDYTRELSRLLFRNLFGCGVICGLKVTGQEATGRCLTVEVNCGVALDCVGDPVQVRQPKSLTVVATCNQALPTAVWVALRRCEHDCMPRELSCPPEAGGQSAAKTRTIDCYEIAVLDHRPAGACGCPEPTATPNQTPGPSVAGGTAVGLETHASAARNPNNPTDREDCYADHVGGVCACACCTGGEWLLLAKLTPPQTVTGKPDSIAWMTDYSVRRFIRPMLLPDPLLASA